MYTIVQVSSHHTHTHTHNLYRKKRKTRGRSWIYRLHEATLCLDKPNTTGDIEEKKKSTNLVFYCLRQAFIMQPELALSLQSHFSFLKLQACINIPSSKLFFFFF